MSNAKNRARMLGATKTLLATLAQTEPRTEILQAAIQALTELIHVKYGAIGLLDEQGDLALFVHFGMSEEESGRIAHPQKGQGLLGAVIRENAALRFDDMANDPRSIGFPANHPRMTSLLVVPISNADRVYGRIYLCDRFDKKAFSDDDEELALSFANALSLILDNARMMEELNTRHSRLVHKAYHDPLTNLPNRTLLCDRIGQVLSHALRNQTQAAILFCDLDGFKGINDSMGHQAGDQVLKTLSARLLSCVRGNDTVARIGGDEFVLVLPEIESVEHVGIVAQKILDAISQPAHIEGRDLPLSGSIGIAIYPFDGNTSEQLMQHADVAMYKAKDSGKNNYQYFTKSISVGCTKKTELLESQSSLESHAAHHSSS
jgi:diguanylate cyclase (GGDEF)-like protein